MKGRSVSMETMSRGGAGLPTSLSGGGLAHLSIEVSRTGPTLRFRLGSRWQLDCLCVSVARAT